MAIGHTSLIIGMIRKQESHAVNSSLLDKQIMIFFPLIHRINIKYPIIQGLISLADSHLCYPTQSMIQGPLIGPPSTLLLRIYWTTPILTINSPYARHAISYFSSSLSQLLLSDVQQINLSDGGVMSRGSCSSLNLVRPSGGTQLFSAFQWVLHLQFYRFSKRQELPARAVKQPI